MKLPNALRHSRLRSRLRPHVVVAFDPSRYAWWPRAATTGRRMRAALARRRRHRRVLAELPALVEQLAELVAAGCGVPAATAWVAWRGRGMVAEDLAEVAQHLRAGRPPAVAWRQWARTTGSAAVGALATVVAIEQPAGDLADQLRGQAQDLRRRAHDERLAALSRRVRLVWLTAVVQLALIGLAIRV